jgi:PAS domain S-box-containing protein
MRVNEWRATLYRGAVTVHRKEHARLSAVSALKRLSQAVEQSADTVLISDCNGLIEYVNPAFEKLTSYSREEVTGKTPRIFEMGRASRTDVAGVVANDFVGQGFSHAEV